MGLRIKKVTTKKELEAFALAPYRFNRNDPAFIGPFLPLELESLDPKKNPFFEHAEAEYYLAYRDGEVVGRISAHTNELHNERYKDKTGFFGFFDCEDDPSTAAALLNTAADYLRSHGKDVMRGPMSFSINDISGLLIEGFEYPPYILMGHNPPYYQALLEGWGLQKAKDLYAWRYIIGEIPEGSRQIADEVRSRPDVTIREVDRGRLKEEVDTIVDIFNSAWSENWGFVPFTKKEVEHFARSLNMILDERIALIAEVEGKPAAIAIALPNINEALSHLRGKPSVLDYMKVLWRLKVTKPKSARLVLLGIKKEFRGKKLGGLSVALYVDIHERSLKAGYREGELGWTLEDNEKINLGITLMGGIHYKTYRIYDKPL